MKTRLIRILPLLIFTAALTMSTPGCFIFKRKNHCGDCPTFKGSAKKH